MKYLLATAAVLALTSVSATGAERYQPDDPEGARVVPPAEYDRPFVGKLEEFIAKDQEEMESFCWGFQRLAALDTGQRPKAVRLFATFICAR
jgi:hypothetical protein